MQDSHIVHHKSGGTTLVGPDAVNLYRAATLASGLRLYARSGILLTRGATPTRLLLIAKEYTGKTYKRKPDRAHYLDAANDVQKWVETMRAALPHVEA